MILSSSLSTMETLLRKHMVLLSSAFANHAGGKCMDRVQMYQI